MRAVTTLAALTACAAAAAVNNLNARSNYALKDSHYVPRSWQRVADADPEHTFQLSIGLKQSQFDDLERHLYEGRFRISYFRGASKVVVGAQKYRPSGPRESDSRLSLLL